MNQHRSFFDDRRAIIRAYTQSFVYRVWMRRLGFCFFIRFGVFFFSLRKIQFTEAVFVKVCSIFSDWFARIYYLPCSNARAVIKQTASAREFNRNLKIRTIDVFFVKYDLTNIHIKCVRVFMSKREKEKDRKNRFFHISTLRNEMKG